MSSSPTVSFSTYSKLVWIWNGLSVGVRRSYPDIRLSSWTKVRIFQVSPQEAYLVHSSKVENLGGYDPFWYLTMYTGYMCPMEPYLLGT